MIWKWILQNISKIDFKVYLIFLFITSFLWLMMKLSDNYNKYVEIELKITDFPDNRVLLSQSDTLIKVFVSAEGFKLISLTNLKSNSISVSAKSIVLKGDKNKIQTGIITSDRIKLLINRELGLKINEKNIKPDSVVLKFDIVSTKILPIVLNADINTTLGFRQYGNAIFSPPMVTISGPASILDTINSIRTKPFGMNNQNSSFSKEIELLIPQKTNLSVEKVQASVQIVEFVQSEIEIPIMVNTNIPNISVKTFPSFIKLTYQVAMPEFKNITDSMFTVAVTLDSMSLLKHNLLIPSLIKWPKSVENIRLSTDKVDFILIK